MTNGQTKEFNLEAYKEYNHLEHDGEALIHASENGYIDPIIIDLCMAANVQKASNRKNIAFALNLILRQPDNIIHELGEVEKEAELKRLQIKKKNPLYAAHLSDESMNQIAENAKKSFIKVRIEYVRNLIEKLENGVAENGSKIEKQDPSGAAQKPVVK